MHQYISNFFKYEVKQIKKIRNFKVRHHATKYSGFETQSPKVLKQGFVRPELFFKVKNFAHPPIRLRMNKFLSLIHTTEKGIIFLPANYENMFSFLFISEDVSYYFVPAVLLNKMLNKSNKPQK